MLYYLTVFVYNETAIHLKQLLVFTQGFRQFCTVADIFLKAGEVNLFGVPRRLASAEGVSYLAGSGEMPPRNF